jgi:hypothetical protein
MPGRSQRRIVEGALVASVLSGAPSVTHAIAGGSPRAALSYALAATRAIGTLLPDGRPGLIRGGMLHGVISLAGAELLAHLLPREHSVAWGALGGLAIGVVNLAVIAPRRFPAIAAFDLGPQIADNVAFGIVFAAVADR